jgi:hypothetical protein
LPRYPAREDFTVYKIAYSPVDEKPEVARKSLKKLVGASGFEPPTSWSRTRVRALLRSAKACGSEWIDNKRVVAGLWNPIELGGFDVHP